MRRVVVTGLGVISSIGNEVSGDMVGSNLRNVKVPTIGMAFYEYISID